MKSRAELLSSPEFTETQDYVLFEERRIRFLDTIDAYFKQCDEAHPQTQAVLDRYQRAVSACSSMNSLVLLSESFEIFSKRIIHTLRDGNEV